jgi:hypothetical protein
MPDSLDAGGLDKSKPLVIGRTLECPSQCRTNIAVFPQVFVEFRARHPADVSHLIYRGL